MPSPRLASRYAKSLIDLAQETGQLEKIYSDMMLLQGLTKSSKDFLNLLRSPIVKADKKIKIVDAVTDGRVSTLTASFNKLLITKGREAALPEIITSFINQYKELKNIHSVKLTTAVPVSDEIKRAIVTQLKNTSDMQNIELESLVNKDLIGGFTLQAGDKLVDASVAAQLKEVARQFENNDFVYQIQ
ncbi:ATP synthase F1 subunit delta [Chitinophagaceae bacterium LB-8]|uniref:ATP synthase subunit delta n=1 Tax=Paraflavisolibacter caeni TaxID=2982496 RepID=A0A9X2XMM9_9BACT|nr:ATP synthase F1 subunit delta [Paraflavisolibacter caeni]MCU7547483.1 ATP synthase F1 subunit delta [Paraflavisolibacter caeni]